VLWCGDMRKEREKERVLKHAIREGGKTLIP
jgi:hypothetical protein